MSRKYLKTNKKDLSAPRPGGVGATGVARAAPLFRKRGEKVVKTIKICKNHHFGPSTFALASAL